MSETNSDAASAIDAVNANGRKSSPTMPSTKAMGRNTAIVAIVDEVIAPATSRTAPTMDCTRSSPGRSVRLMFSMTTMESSTTRPIEIVNAPSVNKFNVYSAKFRPMNVSRIDVGMEIAVTSVARTDRRKTRITSTAKRSPRSPSVVRVCTDCSTYGA